MFLTGLLCLNIFACNPVSPGEDSSSIEGTSGSTTTPPPEKPVCTLSIENDVLGVGLENSKALPLVSQNVESISYTSSQPNVLTIDSNGFMTPLAEGETEITVTATAKDENKTPMQDTCTVVVNDGSFETLNGQERLIKWIGRTFSAAEGVCCYDTASGMEVRFVGTSLTVEIMSAGQASGEYKQTPALCVLIDDETDATKRIVPSPL